MKKAKRLLTIALAALTIVSATAIGTASVSAASLKAPKVSVANSEKGIKISWKKVSGAKQYKVYRNGKLVKKTSKLSTKDFGVVAGKNYTYKVKAVNGKVSSKASAGAKITRINYTVFKEIVNQATSVNVKWNKRNGANKYKVYRSTGSSFKLVKTTTAVSYIDKDVVSGKTYTYKILCVNTKTKTKSLFSTPKKITHLTKVMGVKARENVDTETISLSWTATKAAESYDVYRMKAGDSSYKKIANVSGTTYKDENLGDNITAYSYKVYAVKGSTKSVASDLRIAPYVPKTEDENRYYYDDVRNLHIVLHLTAGEKYKEGKALADMFSVQDLYKAVSDNEEVATVEDGVITAVSAGEAVVTITLTDTGVELINQLDNKELHKLTTKTVYIEIEVE